MSSLVNKVFHYVNVGSFNCHMEGSHLMKRKVEKQQKQGIMDIMYMYMRI